MRPSKRLSSLGLADLSRSLPVGGRSDTGTREAPANQHRGRGDDGGLIWGACDKTQGCERPFSDKTASRHAATIGVLTQSGELLLECASFRSKPRANVTTNSDPITRALAGPDYGRTPPQDGQVRRPDASRGPSPS